MIDTILFDMDGVLIDSEPVSIQIGIDFFKTKGLSLKKKDFAPHLGAGEKAFFLSPAEEHGLLIDYDEASRFFKENYPSLLGRALTGDDTSRLVVRHLRRLGFTLALCSSAPAWKVNANIEAIGLKSDDFDLVVTGEDVTKNKPDGEIYSGAAERLGKGADCCLVVEDSANGVRAGLDASMAVLGLATSLDAASLAALGATFVASDVGILLGGDTMGEVMDNLESGKDARKRYGANLITPVKLALGVTEEQMIKAAAKTRLNAYTPYSHFKVGACVKSAATGRIYTGCNVENSSYGATICAERNAILHAIAEEGTIGVETLVVVSDDNPPAPPCAQCLQVLAEFTHPDSMVILSDLKGNTVRYRFSELLPNPFIFPSMR